MVAGQNDKYPVEQIVGRRFPEGVFPKTIKLINKSNKTNKSMCLKPNDIVYSISVLYT